MRERNDCARAFAPFRIRNRRAARSAVRVTAGTPRRLCFLLSRPAVDVANVCDCASGDRTAKPATARTEPQTGAMSAIGQTAFARNSAKVVAAAAMLSRR
jgi:hypothetical protein